MNGPCQQMQDKMADYVLGVLNELEIDALCEHLRECAECTEYMRALEDENRLLVQLGKQVEADMASREDKLIEALNRSEPTVHIEPLSSWRQIMKSPITKLAIAATVIAVVVLGLVEFIGTRGTSGVVWAEVAQKVQASQGAIFRSTYPDGEPDYAMHYYSGTQYRIDCYKRDQISRTIHGDFNTNTVIYINHHRKTYSTVTFQDLEQASIWAEPKGLIQRFLSHEHRELGQKTIDGVLCEGIETTDPAFAAVKFPVESLMVRAWVSVETGYPVRCEGELAGYNGEDGQLLRDSYEADQFRWDAELDESIFEPDIPPDYIDISP